MFCWFSTFNDGRLVRSCKIKHAEGICNNYEMYKWIKQNKNILQTILKIIYISLNYIQICIIHTILSALACRIKHTEYVIIMMFYTNGFNRIKQCRRERTALMLYHIIYKFLFFIYIYIYIHTHAHLNHTFFIIT